MCIRDSSYTFMDLPHSSSASSSSTLHKFKRGSFSGHTLKSSCNPSILWSKDEDALLMENKKRNLSVMELSILLPQRTEVEIQWRLSVLSSDADVLSPTHSPQRTLSKKTRPRMFKTGSATDDDKGSGKDEDMCDGSNDDDEDNVDPLHRAKPVSYTHLDVYKRQGTWLVVLPRYQMKELSHLNSLKDRVP